MSSIEARQFQDSESTCQLFHPILPPDMKTIRFYTRDGKAIAAERTSTGWMGFGNQGSGEITYSFKAAQAELIAAVETWTGREDVRVKVDLSAGLAIPKF